VRARGASASARETAAEREILRQRSPTELLAFCTASCCLLESLSSYTRIAVTPPQRSQGSRGARGRFSFDFHGAAVAWPSDRRRRRFAETLSQDEMSDLTMRIADAERRREAAR